MQPFDHNKRGPYPIASATGLYDSLYYPTSRDKTSLRNFENVRSVQKIWDHGPPLGRSTDAPLLGDFVALRLVSTGRNGANYGRMNPPQLLIYDQQDRPSFAYRRWRHVEQRKNCPTNRSSML